MSFPYHQYVDYSNPTTPRVYAWEVASASTSTTDQDPLQLQQDPQQPAQPQHQQHQHQHQQISPSQLQLQQLPPPLPLQPQPQAHQHQQLSPHEQVQQLQQQQQQHQLQHQQHQHQQYTPQHQTIHVAPSTGQPQYRFETVTEEDFIHASATGDRPGSSRRRGASKPPALHVDTSRASSASAAGAAAAASSPGALSSTSGPLRVPHTRPHVQSAHPYRRPQSRAASGSGSGVGPSSLVASVRSRRVSELQSIQTPQTSVGGGGGASVGTAPLPTVGTAAAVSCPATNAWREGLLGLSTPGAAQDASGASFDSETTPTATPRPQAQQGFSIPPELINIRRYNIRTDVYYSAEENVMTAMFELPGVKKTDLRLTLSVCPFSRVRQVSVSGTSRSTLPVQGHAVRERKFGEFFRTLAVPPEVTPGSIAVNFEDGILTLKIPAGTPAPAEQPQEIPVP